MQEAVEAEIDKLLKEGHIRRVETVRDEVFIQPVVVTVKKDKTVKIALDARSMNNAILKKVSYAESRQPNRTSGRNYQQRQLSGTAVHFPKHALRVRTNRLTP